MEKQKTDLKNDNAIKNLGMLFVFLLLGFTIAAKEYHVSKSGNDNNDGSFNSPFLTIQAAANLAQPSDIITIHEGIYRERINPPRGVHPMKTVLFIRRRKMKKL